MDRASDGDNRMALPSRLPRLLVGGFFAWWLVMAVSLPTTIWDSNTYNLARLRVAEWGGLFGNPGWNTPRQVMFPWAFDAVHLPFLWIGGGTSLPSFAAFAGILVVVYRMVAARWGRGRAWWCLAAIFALPNVVYQATSSKNDLAVVFGLACWAYGFWLWRREGRAFSLVFGAMGLAFAAGAKTSGVLLGAAAFVFQAGHHLVRAKFRALRIFVLAFGVAAVCLGSVETYVLNLREYDNLLGSPEMIEENRNRDGLPGTAANFLRYFIGNQTLGVDAPVPRPAAAAALVRFTRELLAMVGLSNQGCRFDFNDDRLDFLKDGSEAGSDYSLLGAVALWTGLGILLVRPRTDLLWRLAAVAWGAMGLTAATVAWMPWNARFLLLPFLLLSIVFVLALLGPVPPAPWRARTLLLLVLIGGVYAPLHSHSRKSGDLASSWSNRERMTYLERSGMRDLVRELTLRFPAAGPKEKRPLLLYAAGVDSWVLPLWNLRGVELEPVEGRNPGSGSARAQKVAPRPAFLLTLNRRLTPEQLAGWAKVRDYETETDSALYQWGKIDPP